MKDCDDTRLSPEVASLMGRLVDRLDAAEARGSEKAQSVAFNDRLWPELFRVPYESDKEALWDQIRQIIRLGWLRVSPEVAANKASGYAQVSRISVLDYQAVRASVGRTERIKSVPERWRDAIDQHLDSGEAAKQLAGVYCIDLPHREMEEVVRRLNGLRDLEHQPLLLREVSARLFWGMSKVLDGRQGLVAAVLGRENCPFPASPVQLLVQLPLGGLRGVLFIENQMSFEQAARSRSEHLEGLALAFASGFQASAQRLRNVQGASVYYSPRGKMESRTTEVFESWLFSTSSSLPTLFWGDLDWSGMRILTAMRSSFENIEAWGPGYAPMLEGLMSGQGHAPTTADKQGQLPISATGCPYADNQLLPALWSHEAFVDQEVFTL